MKVLVERALDRELFISRRRSPQVLVCTVMFFDIQ